MRGIVGVALAVLLALALGYFAAINHTTIPIRLGLLAPDRQPQLYVWEIALFSALTALLCAALVNAAFGRRAAPPDRSVEETKKRLSEQASQIAALEERLRRVETLPTEPATEAYLPLPETTEQETPPHAPLETGAAPRRSRK